MVSTLAGYRRLEVPRDEVLFEQITPGCCSTLTAFGLMAVVWAVWSTTVENDIMWPPRVSPHGSEGATGHNLNWGGYRGELVPGYQHLLHAAAAADESWQFSAEVQDLAASDKHGQLCPVAGASCFALTNATGGTWLFLGNPATITARDLEGLFPLPCAALAGQRCGSSVKVTAAHGKDGLLCYEVLNGHGSKCPGPLIELRSATNSTEPVPEVARVESVWGMQPPHDDHYSEGGYGSDRGHSVVGDASTPDEHGGAHPGHGGQHTPYGGGHAGGGHTTATSHGGHGDGYGQTDMDKRYPCPWCIQHPVSCPPSRYILCQAQAAGGQELDLSLALWNVVVAMIFLAFAVTSNTDLWLVLIHTQCLRDVVTVIDAVRTLLAVFLAFWVAIFALWAVMEDSLAVVQNCLGTATLMHYSRELVTAAAVALLLLWALDGLMRLVGVAGMHRAVPVLGHGGLPNAPALSGVIYTDSAYVASGAWRLLHDHADLPKSNGDPWKLLSLAVDAMPAAWYPPRQELHRSPHPQRPQRGRLLQPHEAPRPTVWMTWAGPGRLAVAGARFFGASCPVPPMAGSLGIRHVSGHLDANSCDDPIDEWAARWNDEANKAAKFANRRRHTTFMQSWSAYREAELDMQRRLDQLIRLHLDIAEQLSKNPAAYRLDVDDELEAELPLHVGLLVARPEAQHSSAEWIVPQDAINMHLAASFGQTFFEAAFSWIRQQQQSADACVCLSWLEVVAVLRTEGVPFPVSVSSPHGNVWKDASQYGSYTNAQATVVSDLMLVRSFFRAVASAYGVNIGEIRGLNLAALRVGPPQSGLSISCTRSALLQAEQALSAFTLTRPVRSANDLSRPFR